MTRHSAVPGDAIDPFPKLGPARPPRGDIRCGYQVADGDPTCGAPAIWHVAWRLTPGDAHWSLVCGIHMAAVNRTFVYADRHATETACDMPGTGWLIDDPSRCVIAPTIPGPGRRTCEGEAADA